VSGDDTTGQPGSSEDADAEYARLLAEAAQAGQRQRDLYKKKPDPGDAEACAAHKALVDAAIEAREEAEYAARVYLGEHPDAVPGEARRIELEAAAREYGRAGYPVVPLWPVDVLGQCTCLKAWKCESAGKHPIEKAWQKSATTEPQWWSEDLGGGGARYPQANIGVVLEKENAFVLDMDPDNGGDVTLQQIQERLGDDYDMPATVIVQTGSGGRHFYFEQPAGKPVGNPKFRTGLDIKGVGGLVVAPPSISGKGDYVFIEKHDLVPSDAPRWLLEALAEHDKKQRGEPSKISPEVIPTGRMRAYRKSAMERNARELAESGNTGAGRNNTLNKTAYALGQLAPRGITNEDECREVLYEAASKCGMDFVGDGVEATFNSGGRSGMQHLWWPDWSEEDEAGEEYPARTWDGFGLGDRLVDRYAETLRWSDAAARWMSWQSGQWELDAKDAGERMARPMIESMVDEEVQYDDEATIDEDGKPGDSPRERFRKWVRTCRNPKAMAASAAIAKANALMRIDLERCDSNPLWVNTRSGVYDAATESFHEHDPSQLLTMKAGVRYDPGALCPAWDAFLAEVQPEEDMREFLYRIWGYSMTSDYSEQSIFLNYGTGANGKSVALDVLSMIIGDYGQVVPIETLLTSRNKQGRIPNDVARMRGKRFLKCSETAEGRRLDEALIKQLTGGEGVVARFMRAEYFEFRMTGKIHLTSNFLNHIGDDDATWRRVHLIPWLVTIEKSKQNKYLARDLYEQEASGIFNRLLAGLADWRAREGLCPPDTARKAVEEYRRNEDVLGQAIDERFTEHMDHTECTSACKGHLIFRSGEYLFDEYQRWAGKEAMGKITFYKKLELRGYIRSSYKRATVFPQLSVKADGAMTTTQGDEGVA
jgi:putative DNA primase/helicase